MSSSLRRNLDRVSSAAAWAAAGCLLALAVTLSQSAIHWRPNVVDDHLYAYSGWRLLHGARPYVEVWDNKPPGIWWLNAAAFGLFGDGIAGEIALCSAALAATLATFVWAARSLYGGGATLPALLAGCVLLTHVRFECGGNRTETYLASCEALAAACCLAWARGISGEGRRVRRDGWLFAAGVFAGAAPLFKQNGAAIIAAIGLYVLLVSIRGANTTGARSAPAMSVGRAAVARSVVLLLPGVAAMPLLAAAALAWQAALSAAWSATVEFNRLFFRVGDASWTNLSPGFLRYLPEILPLREMLLLAAAGPLVAGAMRLAAKTTPRSETSQPPAGDSSPLAGAPPHGQLFVWLWLAIAFYLALVGSGRQAYHLAPCLTPLGLLVLRPLMVFVGNGSLSATLARRIGAGALLMGFVGLLLPVAEDSLTSASRCWREKPAWWALRRTRSPEYEQQAAVIRALTTPRDEIYVWGWSPGTYRFAYRRCPARHATLEHVSHVAPYGEFIVETAMREIMARPPRVFVISLDDLAGLRPSRPEFAAWLESEYALHETVAGMHIFLRQNAMESAHKRCSPSLALRGKQ